MIKFEHKDVTTVESGIIIHGCNAQGVMGSGVAGALRRKWPQIFDSYKASCDRVWPAGRSELLGTFTSCVISDDPKLIVINGVTQEHFGSDGKVYANVHAIKRVLTKVIGAYAPINCTPVEVYLPRIGCGLGGLDWESDVLPVLMDVDANVNRDCTLVNFIVCDV